MIKSKTFVFLILGFLILLNAFAWLSVYDLNNPQALEVIFFDIGQGDAIFIETPQGRQILIDGGQDTGILEKLGDEMPFWDRTIDLVILTHPEHDHYGGLIEVLKNYKVENILWTGVLRNTSEYKEWQKTIKEEEEQGAQIRIARAGQLIHLGNQSNRYMEVLYPFEDLEGQEIKNTNNTSIIIRLVFKNNSFLFTGDAYQSVEKKLLENEIDVDSDVLKVGHHGSKTSSSEEFIKQVSPDIAVISAGKDNPYHHPHQETLKTLEKYGIKILRTDLNNDIKLTTNGEKINAVSDF